MPAALRGMQSATALQQQPAAGRQGQGSPLRWRVWRGLELGICRTTLGRSLMPSKVSTWSGPYTAHTACWQSAPATQSAWLAQSRALHVLHAGGGPQSSLWQLQCSDGRDAVMVEALACRTERVSSNEGGNIEGQAGPHREGQGLDGEPGAARQVEGTHRAPGPQQHLRPIRLDAGQPQIPAQDPCAVGQRREHVASATALVSRAKGLISCMPRLPRRTDPAVHELLQS